MIVVSDTSAIINLAAVGQLHLLSELYGTVLIPRAVRSEIVAGGPNAPGAAATSLAWIQTAAINNQALASAQADYLVTGDKGHLLSLKEAAGVPIIAALEFLHVLGISENPT